MAWEQRKTGMYYYRKVRQGQRVVSECVGSRSAAELIAQHDSLLREIAADHRAEARQVRTSSPAEQLASEVAVAIADLGAVALVLSGYYRHKRQWRKRRERC